MDDTGVDRCPVCWSPVADSAQWVLLSRHQTSEGVLEYCLSGCGCVAVLLGGDLVKAVPHGCARLIGVRPWGPGSRIASSR
ncbi:hypothetical protein CRV15_34030 (plasmid) [Streptomyces clavuligerus]|uniref:Uncharacterized protein n=1 Tax=Streptomyces clavuligerus TaxID=1901 RepID=B5GYQ7_STRCL|nr:hypothetical protein D1794_33315 [Streptomyces clavuligerus]EDY51453.1 hypothetical protein SSCG_04658 [Streptomyces clavuligerus]EFG04704.1 Hypothetical protein SCLAV_p1218 [Streptomyces clavuligerus]QCS10554.1 hypothetical protein CRV15_34030 [Streptomyces clavuligerus]QPJ97408.1 hypothetical protein GE265_30445 [Streptomyces clavuligerus]